MTEPSPSRRHLLSTLAIGSAAALGTPRPGQASGGSDTSFAQTGLGSVPRSIDERLRETISVFDYLPAPVQAVVRSGGEGHAAETRQAIQAAIAEASARGGGTVYLPVPGPWFIDIPLQLASNLALQGCTQITTIRKATQADFEGVDCVIYGRGLTRFRIENISVHGNRTGSGRAKSGSSHGFYLKDCAYFDLDNTRADYCTVGYRLSGCYTSGIAQSTALRCAGYGFQIENSSTSLVLRNTTSWGCGGGWSIANSVYISLIGCACDSSDAGLKPGDPFGDSGGDYRSPGYIFELSGAKGIAIIAPGCEQSNSQWLYAEGAQAEIITPYVFGMEAHSKDWKFIQLRGTGYSNISITNPFGFDTVANKVGPGAKAIYIENPANQKLFVSGRWRVNDFGGADAYSTDGIVPIGGTAILDYNQQRMVEGKTVFIPDGAGTAEIVTPANAPKKLLLKAPAARQARFSLPLPDEGMMRLKVLGAVRGPGKLRIALEERGTGARTLRVWQNAAAAVAIGEWLHAAVEHGRSLWLTIELAAGSEAEFTQFELMHIDGQA